MRQHITVALIAVVVAHPVFAKNKKPIDPNQKVCRAETPTGSVMSRTTCHTLTEWQAIEGVYKRSTDSFFQGNAVGAHASPELPH